MPKPERKEDKHIDRLRPSGGRLKRIIAFLRRVNIFWLTLIPPLGAFAIFIGWGYFRQRIFVDNVSINFDGLVWGFASFVMSLGGLAQIWRREAPGPMMKPIHGPFAVVTGIVGVTFLWLLGGSLIFLGLFNK